MSVIPAFTHLPNVHRS